MSGVVAEDVLRSAAERWRRIDPLLPEPKPPGRAGCGAQLTVLAANGRPAAAGWCHHQKLKPEAPELAWGATAQFWLTAGVAGDPGDPGIGAALDELLARWRAHLAAEPTAASEDSQAAVRWPSRDVGGVRALLRHGLQPLTVIAARSAGRAGPDSVPRPRGLRIRPAGPADVAAVTEFSMEVIRFDEQFGSVLLHPHAERTQRQLAELTLARTEPWTPWRCGELPP
jgi:hypothetical protein